MNPDVPEWAREVLERELTRPDVDSFHVLKDSPLQKLGIGRSPHGTFVVQRTLAGGQLFRVDADESPRVPPHASRGVCAECGATFRYARATSGGRLHCIACGSSLVETDQAPPGRPPAALATPSAMSDAFAVAPSPREAARVRRLERDEFVAEACPPGRTVPQYVPAVGDAEGLSLDGFTGLEGVGPAHVNALRAAGIDDLEALRRADVARVARVTGAPERVVRRWQAMSALLELEGVVSGDAKRLADAGVESLDDLAVRKPDELAERVGVPIDLAARWVLEARARR